LLLQKKNHLKKKKIAQIKMTDSSNEFTIYNLVRCEFNPDDNHIFNDPRSLPCGNSACLSCLEHALDEEGQINCKLCNEIHNVNITELPRMLPIERAIETHVVRLTKFILSKSKEISNNLAGKKRFLRV
jgi:hypothetical protein